MVQAIGVDGFRIDAAKHFPTPVREVVTVPLAHDTPAEIAQAQPLQWIKGGAVPGHGGRMAPTPKGLYVTWGAAGVLSYLRHADDPPAIAERIVDAARKADWRTVEWLGVR